MKNSVLFGLLLTCVALAMPAHSSTVQSVAIIGDVDDFNNVDQDGVADIQSGEFIPGPLVFADTNEGLTDTLLLSNSPVTYDFVFNIAPGQYTAAAISVLTADVDRPGEGFDTASILLDDVLTGFSLTASERIFNAAGSYFTLDTFVLSAGQLALLQDGTLKFSVEVGPLGVSDDGAHFDYVSLQTTLAPIPVPGALALLLTALGFGALAQRRKAASA